MSTVKANNHQVGQSATANQNFTLYQPTVPDGTVRLGVGNSGATTADALTVTNAGNATLLGNLTVSGAGTSTFAGTLNATTALQSGGVAASRIVQGTAQATTSGSSAIQFTSLPSWVKRITFSLAAMNCSGSWIIQIGSGSYVTSGYTGVSTLISPTGINNTVTNTSGVTSSGGFTQPVSGSYVFVLEDPATNKWVCTGSVYYINGGTTYINLTTVYLALSGALDRIQLNPSGGSFSGGSVNIIYEG